MCPGNETAAPVGAEHSTLYLAIEISGKSWMVGVKSPVSDRISLHSLGPVDAATVEGLRKLIEDQRAKANQTLGREVRVLCCYEAGYEGFWLVRWLDQEMSIETVVLDPASLLVNRKAKQRKTDRIDAKKMVRALLAHDRGDAAVLSRVRVPSLEEEDRKRLLRERRRLVKERTSLTNSIKGLLKLQGVFGLTPVPWASGDTQYDQGIGRDGPGWIRALLIQMAWRWLRHQPESALSKWFEERTAGARGRIRRVMIVALARKLLVALWRFCETGLVPTGAKLA